MMEPDVLLSISGDERKNLNVPEWRIMEHLQREITVRDGQLDVNAPNRSAYFVNRRNGSAHSLVRLLTAARSSD
jgi:hypothetical protein